MSSRRAGFEASLSLLLRRLRAGNALDEALEPIARRFEADTVQARLGSPRARVRKGPGRVVVPLHIRGPQHATSDAFVAERRGRAWSRLEVERLHVVAGIVESHLRLGAFEREALENRVWLYLALESGGVGTWDWDVATDRVRFLTPFHRTGGVPEVRETVGASWFKTTHPEDIPAARSEVERAIVGETDGFDFVVRSQHPPYRDGGWLHVRSRGKVVARDRGGRALRIVGIHEDVTEAKHAEAAERELRATRGLLESLTRRETEVADLILAGLRTPEIARRLDLSQRTVEMHRSRLLRRLGAKTSAEAARVLQEARDRLGLPGAPSRSPSRG